MEESKTSQTGTHIITGVMIGMILMLAITWQIAKERAETCEVPVPVAVSDQ